MTNTLAVRKQALADILQNPKDDTPRLMFADWLDDQHETGEDPYARFIRTQIELAKLPPPRKVIERRGDLTYTHSPSTGALSMVLPHEEVAKLSYAQVVDVRVTQTIRRSSDPPSWNEYWFYGCVVGTLPQVRVGGGAEVSFLVTGERDEHEEKRERLREQEKELLTVDNARSWFSTEILDVGRYDAEDEIPWFGWGWIDWENPLSTNSHIFPFHVTRGFVSCVSCNLYEWKNVRAEMRLQPIERVLLSDIPPTRTTPGGRHHTGKTRSRIDGMAWVDHPWDKFWSAREGGGPYTKEKFLLKHYWPGIDFLLPGDRE